MKTYVIRPHKTYLLGEVLDLMDHPTRRVIFGDHQVIVETPTATVFLFVQPNEGQAR